MPPKGKHSFKILDDNETPLDLASASKKGIKYKPGSIVKTAFA
jgi:hypothetical protein